jgi:hypothetical protein
VVSIQVLTLKGFILISTTLSFFAQAHSIEERYDLPLPLPFFIIGSGIVVLVSFLFLFFATPRLSYINKNSKTVWNIFSQPTIQRLVIFIAKAFSIILFFTVLGACFWGNPDPLENLAPNFIWITWWLGLSLVISFTGNFWPIVNPWNALFEVFQWFLKKLFAKTPTTLNLHLPQFLGMYISTGFLLTWSWLELVYPVAFVPQKIGQLIVIWTFINFIFMYLFGVSSWQSRGDVFSIYFYWLGKFGLYFFNPLKHTLERRYLCQGLWSHIDQLNQPNQTLGLSSFIIAMLSTVLFDGLHGSSAWLIFEQYLLNIFPHWLVASSYFSGTFGLLMTWLLFWGLFWCCCFIPQKYCSTIKLSNLADYLAPSLIPIAVGYLIAHNFSSFVIQFQNIIFLISDPFHLGWDLFHTKTFRPNIAIIDAGFTWYLALSAILVGHILALWISHLLLVQKTQLRKDLLLMSVAHTLLMVGLTMTSLMIIAEPMTLS